MKPELCCSRAQEVNAVKKDPAVSTDAAGLLKLATKATEAHCDAGSEIKLRAAWQRRNLAMDLAGLVSFPVAEGWVQFLYSHLLRDPPRGFAKISLQTNSGLRQAIVYSGLSSNDGKLTGGSKQCETA